MNGARFTTSMPCMMLSVSNLSGSTTKARTEQKDLCGSHLTLLFLFVTRTTHDKCMCHPQFSLVSSQPPSSSLPINAESRNGGKTTPLWEARNGGWLQIVEVDCCVMPLDSAEYSVKLTWNGAIVEPMLECRRGCLSCDQDMKMKERGRMCWNAQKLLEI